MAFAALSAAEGEGMSKSAKRRANKKAREAEGEPAEAAPPAPAAKAKAAAEPSAKAAAKAAAKSAPAAPAPAAAKAKAKADAAPQAKAKADAAPKAKAQAKAQASPAQAPAADPDQPMSNAAKKRARQAAAAAAAEAEAKAAAEAAAAAQAKAAAEAAAAAKAAAKSKGKAKAKAEPKKEEPVRTPEPVMHVEYDDGTGAAWDTVATTKKQKPKEKKQEDKAAAPATKSAPASGGYPAAKAKAAPVPAAQQSPEDKAARFEALKAKIKEEAKAEALAAHVAYVASKPKADGEGGEASADVKAPTCVVSLKVPEGAVGRIIGPKGATLELIKEKCGVSKIDTQMGMATICGDTQEACAKAETAIKELIEKGYMSIAYENLKEDKVVVMSPDLPDIIGKKGSVVSKIKEELSVEIDIPRQPDAAGDKADKAPKVTKVEIKIAGEADKVELAKEVINHIVMYGHHETTHPGMAHKELDVEDHQYRYIIGRAGSEMRHIQNSYRVRVNIPRDHSKNKKVVVVGEQLDVDRACAYIEKAIGTAESEQKDREKQQAEREANGRSRAAERDEDGPIEPWMKQYMRSK
eukprot:TRINITY_DN136_c0_g1_i1.p1 TRINITY_DN136_c0_g1~~TRINITY_DN136_c0_g1_i1.p1  ORF type:complete len:580 (+),score=211.48 TRINITY_DN136_c0_g1_i1:61-1800(+)